MRYFIMGTSSNVVSGTWELSLFKTNVIIDNFLIFLLLMKHHQSLRHGRFG